MTAPRPTIIAAVGQKGGSGKSTVCLSLAVEYAIRGARVLVGDADPQATSLTWGAVASEAGQGPAITVVGLHKGFHRPGQLPLEGYDVVVLDTPARLAVTTRSALMLADLAVVPVTAGGIEAWALASTLDLVEEARTVRPDLQAWLLINRAQRTALTEATRQTLRETGLPVLSAELGFRVAYQAALTGGAGPSTYEPSSKAAAEVRALADELMEILSNVQTQSA